MFAEDGVVVEDGEPVRVLCDFGDGSFAFVNDARPVGQRTRHGLNKDFEAKT